MEGPLGYKDGEAACPTEGAMKEPFSLQGEEHLVNARHDHYANELHSAGAGGRPLTVV